MKILYGSGNYIGSNIMASRFLQNVEGHDVRVAAHFRNHSFMHSFDWCLDALYQTKVGDRNYFKVHHGMLGPYVNHSIADMIINDLLEWEPELVISDCEFFTAMIAKVFEIPLWYCSPMLQIVGIEREKKEIHAKLFEKFRVYFDKLPQGNCCLVYSPLCDIQGRPYLKEGFEWIRPYVVQPKQVTSEDIDLELSRKAIPKSCLLTTGETSFVSDCLYSGKFTFVTPHPKDAEQNLNAQLLEWYGVGRNIGRSNSLSFIKNVVEKPHRIPILSIQEWKELDERLNDFRT